MSKFNKSDEYRIVYSSDGSHLNEKKHKHNPQEQVIPEKTELKLRLEKSGRGGKVVSVIYSLPNNPDYFKLLLKDLKNHCGVGGTFKDNRLELQGDQKAKIKAFLEKKGFRVKLSGA